MKFRVEAKDFIIFIVFCLFLLYLCAIAVVNFSSFSLDGTFAGLNPLPAFIGGNLVFTLLMFGAALVMIFSSVSSYIFNRDKNAKHLIDFSQKEEKGYSRWSKEKEIKEAVNVKHVKAIESSVEAAGIPLINNGTDIWVDDGEYHNMVIGSTGSGKTETIVKPMVNLLAKKGESMIITDPKGELYAYSAEYLKQQGYNIIVLNFRDTERGNTWNPLTLPYQYYKDKNMDKSTELLDDVAANIIKDSKSKDPFWENSAADYFSGLALGLFQDAKEEEINLNSINLMSTVGEDRIAASNYIKEYFTAKGESSSAYIFASNTFNSPTDTKGGILSTFRQKIRLFSSRELLSEMLSYSDFDMREIGRQKTAVFMIIHDEKTTYHSLLTIFIKQCYETLIDVAKENGGKLPFRTNFILDEFANMPQLKDVDSMVSAARSRAIRFTFIIQNFSQLNDVYGKEVAEIIKGNCGNLIYLISTEMAALEEISKMCGEVKSKENDKTASTPLVSVSDLQKLKLFEAVIKRLRMNPFKTKYTPDFEMNWGIDRKIADLPYRERKEIQLFDIKTFVSEEKRKKMLNSMDGNGPTGTDMNNPFNPFGGSTNPFANNQFNPNNNNPFAANNSNVNNLNNNPFNNNSNTGMFGNANQNMNDPFASSPPTGVPNENKTDANPFGNFLNNGLGNLSDEEIDKMIADIDNKLKALEEEEKKEQEKLKSPQIEEAKIIEQPPVVEQVEAKPIIEQEIIKPVVEQVEAKPIIEQEVTKPVVEQIEVKPVVEQSNSEVPTPIQSEMKTEIKVEPTRIEKPKVNVDVDSVIMDESIITDDEFFDDFFMDE